MAFAPRWTNDSRESTARSVALNFEAGHARTCLRCNPKSAAYPHTEEFVTVAPATVKDKGRANVPREIDLMLQVGAALSVSTSSGKDSQAMTVGGNIQNRCFWVSLCWHSVCHSIILVSAVGWQLRKMKEKN